MLLWATYSGLSPGQRLKELGSDNGFERFCVPRFERQAEAEDMMKAIAARWSASGPSSDCEVSWECVSTDAPVPEDCSSPRCDFRMSLVTCIFLSRSWRCCICDGNTWFGTQQVFVCGLFGFAQ